MGEISGDHTVEVVTDAMLDKLVAQFNHVAVLFYEKENEDSAAVLEALVILGPKSDSPNPLYF